MLLRQSSDMPIGLCAQTNRALVVSGISAFFGSNLIISLVMSLGDSAAVGSASATFKLQVAGTFCLLKYDLSEHTV